MDEILGLLMEWARQFDAKWRFRDWRAHKAFGNRLHCLGVDGYSPLVLFLLVGILTFQALGPSIGTSFWGLTVWLLVITAVCVGLQRLLQPHVRLHYLHWGLAALVSIGSFALAKAGSTEAGFATYRHIFAPILWILLGALAFAEFYLSPKLFSEYKGLVAPCLQDAELFTVPPANYGTTWATMLFTFVSAPFQRPLFILLPPALMVVLFYDRGLRLTYIVHIGLAFWFLVAMSMMSERLNFMIERLRRVFFVGAQLGISCVIIGLATARLLDIQYVTVVLESQVWQSLMMLILCAYLTSWFYEYWLNHIITERLLAVISAGPLSSPPRVRYPINAEMPRTNVAPEGRWIQVHAGRRLAVTGHKEISDGYVETFETYGRSQFFETLFQRATARNRNLAELQQEVLTVLKRRIRLYFYAMNTVVTLAFLGLFFWLRHQPQAAQLCIQPPAADGELIAGAPPIVLQSSQAERRSRGVDLRALLGGRAHSRRILVAVSGGGTRAALYGASVLHGLQRLGADKDIVAMSGVSGGSAAIAYFASHRDILTKGLDSDWKDYYSAMSLPFIRDVLNGLVEWRIANGVRLGALLNDSFRRRFRAEKDRDTLGKNTDLALMFNTTVAGHLHRDALRQDELPSFGKWAFANQSLTRATSAGTHLVFTNLSSTAAFDSPGITSAAEANLKHVAVNEPNVPLTAAAALSANFPPVFSNAAVDVDGTDRFWVTDGGASDNLGLVPLLLALHNALGSPGRCPGNQGLPDIHIIAADASAARLDYTQDRGIGAASGASEKYATELSSWLLADIRARYRCLSGHDGVYLHFLAMPMVLRSRGGIGTHWALPDEVHFDDSDEGADPGSRSFTASKKEILEAFRDLENPLQDPCAVRDSGPKGLWARLCSDRPHRDAWLGLQKGLARH
ncbi:MAG: patatin-like phospholipase family protein [Elusimicrobia bacterium]|nr:patatin-like phospholipase family protein [Elusimicrobiota bacterium]